MHETFKTFLKLLKKVFITFKIFTYRISIIFHHLGIRNPDPAPGVAPLALPRVTSVGDPSRPGSDSRTPVRAINFNEDRRVAHFDSREASFATSPASNFNLASGGGPSGDSFERIPFTSSSVRRRPVFSSVERITAGSNRDPRFRFIPEKTKDDMSRECFDCICEVRRLINYLFITSPHP